MDIDTLRQTLNSHLSGGVFDLDASDLASNELTQLFALYLPDKRLGLTAATLTSGENSTLLVSGLGSTLPFSAMTVQAIFSIVNGTVEMLLSASAPQGWTLPASFPAWQHKFFPPLSFATPPQLYLSTAHAAPNSVAGLMFSGQLDIQSVMGPFSWLVGGLSTLLLKGSITMSDVGPQTVLSTDSATTTAKSLSFLELAPVVLEVATDADLLANPSPLNAPVFLRFKTSIDFLASTGTIALPLQATFSGQDQIAFDADLNQLVSASLDAFASLLNNVDITKPDLLPPGLELEQIIKLQFLTMHMSIIDGSPHINLVSIGVEKQGDPWHITNGVDIDDLAVHFSVSDPLGLKYLSVGVYGTIAIGGGKLDISAVYPDFMLVAEMEDGTEINLLEIIAQFSSIGEDSSIGMDLIEVDLLNFSLTLSPLSYSVAVALDGLWYIPLISDVYLEMGHLAFNLDKQADAGVTGSLAAMVIVAGVDINISASVPEADGGWIFAGSTGPNQEIAIGTLMASLADLFGDITLPEALSELTIENVSIIFNSLTTDFTFTCEGKLPIDGTLLDITVLIDLKDGESGYTKTFGGHIRIGDLIFDLHFVQSAPSTAFVATYSHTGVAQNITIRELIAPVSSDIASVIPADLSIDLKDVLFVYSKDTAGSTFLFGLDVSGTIPSLTNLPLIGQELPTDQTISVNDLQILVVSQDVQQSFVDSVNKLLPDGVTHLAATGLSKGLALTASITFGDTPQILAVPVVDSNAAPAPPSTQPNVTAANNAKWFTLQKSFGPIHFNRVGFQYKDAAVFFLLDAALSAFGLTISLDGLALGSPLSKFAPTFNLSGLGIDYQSADVVEISGAFLNAGNDEFAGEALIKTSELTISALGSYATLNGNPSLFVYAVVDQPIGGPAFFFVTGLAAGFGYNRSLVVPPIEQISQFPLIEEVMSGTHRSLGDELRALDQYIPPSLGDLFFAIGVRFTSFKLIDSFALLTVALGNRVEVDVLGLSTLISPPPEKGVSVPPLAEVYMALKASFAPQDGFMGVNAQLTSASYLFSKDCHLTGGFAFYSWFAKEHAGDFVISLGGYHPAFTVPDHYPKLPRLGFSWQVDSNLLMKGSLYYALTASAIMAGGSLEVTWSSGPFKAWFSAGADFLLSWKPYHYDASFHINVGASYTFTLAGTHHLTVDVGANVHMWGPDFSGLAHIDLSIISFDVTFGSGSSQAPLPIDWPTFKTSFLPNPKSVCSIAVKSGLVSTPQTGAVQWVLNPKEFVVAVGTAIPISKATFNGQDVSDVTIPASGIGPMAVTVDDLLSQYDVTISDSKGKIRTDDFTYKPILKNMPAGLWGQQLQPNLNGNAFIYDALTGFEIRPKQEPEAGEIVEIEPNVLLFTPEPLSNIYTWQTPLSFTPNGQEDEARRSSISQTIASSATANARNALLGALGLTTPITVDASIADAFMVAPQVAQI